MSPLSLSWKSLRSEKLTFLLNCLLITFGTGILTILILASAQIKEKLGSNAKDIDLVVGAKGSPLQLILSSIYHIDFPTGNVPLEEAEALARNPMVKKAVPLALGDNYNGFRITGTDTGFIGLYGLQLASGKFWEADFEVTIGANVASHLRLRTGDRFFGAHGFTAGQEDHTDHPYIVAGILAPQKNVTDNLILTNISSIWKMHEPGEKHVASTDEKEDREITSLLIQYRSPMSIVLFPQMVNKHTNMQAASPALESGRLFSLIGVGMDTLQWFAILIMFMAAVSVFVSLYNSLKERRYDLAVMRIMGASQQKLFIVILLEGIILMLAGSCLGILSGHLALQLIGNAQDVSQAGMSGLVFVKEEIYLFMAATGIGFIAALIPAIQAYRSDIAAIISKN